MRLIYQPTIVDADSWCEDESLPPNVACTGLPRAQGRTSRPKKYKAIVGAAPGGTFSVRLGKFATGIGLLYALEVPQGAIWEAGDWTIPLNVEFGPPPGPFCWVSTYVCRIKDGGQSIATIGSNLNHETFLILGVYWIVVAGTAQAADPGDYVVVVFHFRNDMGGDNVMPFLADQVIGTPLALPEQGATVYGGPTEAPAEVSPSTGLQLCPTVRMVKVLRGAAPAEYELFIDGPAHFQPLDDQHATYSHSIADAPRALSDVTVRVSVMAYIGSNGGGLRVELVAGEMQYLVGNLFVGDGGHEVLCGMGAVSDELVVSRDTWNALLNALPEGESLTFVFTLTVDPWLILGGFVCAGSLLSITTRYTSIVPIAGDPDPDAVVGWVWQSLERTLVGTQGVPRYLHGTTVFDPRDGCYKCQIENVVLGSVSLGGVSVEPVDPNDPEGLAVMGSTVRGQLRGTVVRWVSVGACIPM